MTRRDKLTKRERAKRREKKERRAEARNHLVVRYREALRAYIRALTHEGRNPDRCICEKCGLEQEYLTGEVSYPSGLVTIYVCEGWEGMGCGGEYCRPVDDYLSLEARAFARTSSSV